MSKPTPEDVKRAFPECCALVDEFRAVFGPEVKPLFMREGDREIGRRTPDGNAVPLSQMVLADKVEEKEARPVRARTRDKWKAAAPKPAPKYIEEP
jgi:hypothetical protein